MTQPPLIPPEGTQDATAHLLDFGSGRSPLPWIWEWGRWWRGSVGYTPAELATGRYVAPLVPGTASGGPANTLDQVSREVEKARANWPPFNSAHEGFAILLEEVDELRNHVWTNQKRRDLAAMRQEAIQVAAMAVRIADEVCSEERGRR